MKGGDLDRRIKIERFTTTYNDFNEPVQTWTTYATVSASKKEISDGERWRAAEVQAEVTTRFVVRWSTKTGALTPKDRIEYPIGSGKLFDISGIKEIGRKNRVEITASARADGGD